MTIRRDDYTGQIIDTDIEPDVLNSDEAAAVDAMMDVRFDGFLRSPDLHQAFLSFLTSPEAAAIIERYARTRIATGSASMGPRW